MEHEGEALNRYPSTPIERVTLEGLPFKPSLKGGFKFALKERGLEGRGGEHEGEALKGYPSSPP